ncbi:MAG: sigma-70 family RNA polymerase sigma factor [Myxococcales bacterium]|nr:sigma-70 family RNA polymerase sigma factor [Myxococcales bacterium]MBK7192098.1 sigma-70 family RNA polymerase sigma factor [Myxococcales bacterium]MBP6845113.1 sigma-70 family RNA polymerase sigma factor [Kofleriaceae bacterium]
MELDGTDDVELFRRVGGGDVDAFAALVRRHQAAMVAVAFAITCDRDQALDLTQEAFVKAWQRIREVRDPARLGAWLCGVVRFLARDQRRLDRRRAALRAEVPPPPPTATPLVRALTAEDERLLSEVVRELPATLREPLLLHHVAGCSVAQIAAALAVGEDAIRQRLSRGRAALRELLARHGADEPRFARAALALVPPTMFTPATLRAATTQAPAGAAKESFMAAHPVLTIAAVVAVAAGGGALAAARRDTSSSTSTAAPTAPAAASPVEVTDAAAPTAPSRGDRAALREAIRSARARAAARAATAAPTADAPTLTYDFAGEALRADAAPPTAADAAPTTSGKAAIRAAFRAIQPAVRACYQAALARTPGLTGTLTVQVRLEGAAGVGIVADEPEVHDDPAAPIGDATLAACVGAAAASLELPMPAEDVAVVVHYPYQLAP